MKVHDLKPAPGSTHKKKRKGRGIGGHGGKTAGRGTKGQRARNTVRVGFEGGQMPLHKRIPKLRGFNNPFRIEYQAVNLDTLEDFDGSDITPEALLEHGLVSKGALVKILARGEITRAVNVSAHKFSEAAAEAIKASGGTVTELPLPFKQGRPAANGSAHQNR